MHRSWSLQPLMICLAALAGCGDFVRYDEEPPPSAAAVDSTGDQCAQRPDSTALDYGPYDSLLADNVELDAEDFAIVDYAQLGTDVDVIDALLSEMTCAAPQPDDLAFWLNMYNASVLRAVIEARKADPNFRVDADDFAFFKQRIVDVAGQVMSLDELEHGVIRGQADHAAVLGSPDAVALEALHSELWGGSAIDARIHMALNCAARSCPNMRAGAFSPSDIEAQLAEATGGFLDNPGKGAGPDGISSLFDWFSTDFSAASGSVANFIEANRTDGLTDVDQATFIPYDWALNGR